MWCVSAPPWGAPAGHVSRFCFSPRPCPDLWGFSPCFVSSALRREVECLTQEQSEARKQSEKDRAALLSQMKVFEAELEEQLSRHEACAKQAEELSALRQQMAALDKHLRSQRQFMDVSILTKCACVPERRPCSVSVRDTVLGLARGRGVVAGSL